MESAPKKERILKELEQVKLLLEGINKHLEETESISKEDLKSISSELKDPIVTIKGYTDMLLEGHFGLLVRSKKKNYPELKQIRIC